MLDIVLSCLTEMLVSFFKFLWYLLSADDNLIHLHDDPYDDLIDLHTMPEQQDFRE